MEPTATAADTAVVYAIFGLVYVVFIGLLALGMHHAVRRIVSPLVPRYDAVDSSYKPALTKQQRNWRVAGWFAAAFMGLLGAATMLYCLRLVALPGTGSAAAIATHVVAWLAIAIAAAYWGATKPWDAEG